MNKAVSVNPTKAAAVNSFHSRMARACKIDGNRALDQYLAGAVGRVEPGQGCLPLIADVRRGHVLGDEHQGFTVRAPVPAQGSVWNKLSLTVRGVG